MKTREPRTSFPCLHRDALEKIDGTTPPEIIVKFTKPRQRTPEIRPLPRHFCSCDACRTRTVGDRVMHKEEEPRWKRYISAIGQFLARYSLIKALDQIMDALND